MTYDYIFLGAGCASLSIVMRMLDSPELRDKKILLIEKAAKNTNDRTWCYWEKQAGYFEDVVVKKWNNLSFFSPEGSISLNISPYQYKMIRGVDFYRHCFSRIARAPTVEVLYGDISINDTANMITVGNVPLDTTSAIVFNSIYKPAPPSDHNIYLLQHFKGWIIETDSPSFNDQVGTFMDFRVGQGHGTTFVYVLPLSPTRALIEYTLFTATLLKQEEYEAELKKYISDFLQVGNYKIVEEEFGIIPMTNASFPVQHNGMYYIGTAGGTTKASSGYTFQFIQKAANNIVRSLVTSGTPPKSTSPPRRFEFYDSTLLHILAHHKVPGHAVFTRLFQRNKAAEVFKFLDNETSIPEEINLIKSLPILPFSLAGVKEFSTMFRK